MLSNVYLVLLIPAAIAHAWLGYPLVSACARIDGELYCPTGLYLNMFGLAAAFMGVTSWRGLGAWWRLAVTAVTFALLAASRIYLYA